MEQQSKECLIIDTLAAIIMNQLSSDKGSDEDV
jgi:hypothetical protein